jgi:hypothetical protein
MANQELALSKLFGGKGVEWHSRNLMLSFLIKEFVEKSFERANLVHWNLARNEQSLDIVTSHTCLVNAEALTKSLADSNSVT